MATQRQSLELMRKTQTSEVAKSPKVVALQKMFPTFSEFTIKVNPDIQHKIVENRMGMVECARRTEAPSLALIKSSYGREAAETWICIQFEQLNAYAENGRGFTDLQIKELSMLILNEYYFLNVYEVSLFIVNIKLGKYGEFFGAVGPMKIMTSLNKYVSERRQALCIAETREEQERMEREREDSKKNSITYEEYLRRKESGEFGNISQNTGHSDEKGGTQC